MTTPFQHRHASKQETGFTFLEVMIAMLIVSIGMLGAMGLSSYILRSSKWSERVATGNMAGQDKLEELRDSSFLSLASGSDTQGIFARSWTVSDFADGKEISMQVSWISVDGIGHATQMQAFLSDPRNSNGTVTITEGVGDTGGGEPPTDDPPTDESPPGNGNGNGNGYGRN